MNTRNTILAVAGAVLLLALLVLSIGGGPQANAAPMAAPTPVAGTYTGGTLARAVTLYSGVIATSTAVNGSGVSILTGDRVDLQYVIDQTAVNTVTAKLQFSNNGTNWVDGATFATANAADANDMQQYNVFGALARVNVAATNTNPVTVTVIAVVK